MKSRLKENACSKSSDISLLNMRLLRVCHENNDLSGQIAASKSLEEGRKLRHLIMFAWFMLSAPEAWYLVNKAPDFFKEKSKEVELFIKKMLSLRKEFLNKLSGNDPSAIHVLREYARSLTTLLKHFALQDRLVIMWFDCLHRQANDETLESNERKQAQIQLRDLCESLIPNLRIKKSKTQFTARLREEFKGLRTLLKSKLKKSYRGDAGLIAIREILDKAGVNNLMPENLLNMNNTERAYAILAKKYLSSSGTIEQNIKSLNRKYKLGKKYLQSLTPTLK